MTHPADDPLFDALYSGPVWYLAHPVASDGRFTLEQNLAHVLKILPIFVDAGVHVLCPWYAAVACLDDKNPSHRRLMLEADIACAQALGRVLLTGHKISRGMELEAQACSSKKWINLVGISDAHLPGLIESYRDQGMFA